MKNTSARRALLASTAAVLVLAACTNGAKKNPVDLGPTGPLPTTDRAPSPPPPPSRTQALSTAPKVTGQIVVRYKPSASAADIAGVREDVGGTVLDTLPAPRQELLAVPAADVAKTVQALEDQPDVLYAEPNYILSVTATPNDPRFGELWGMQDSGATRAWDTTTGNRDVIVGVVDSGVAYDHPDLAPNMWVNPGESGGGRESNGIDDDGNGFVDDWHGWDFHDGDNDPRDENGHGTHVAGTIGARGNDGIGVTGMDWNVTIMPVRAMGADGRGSMTDIAAAFDYAASNGAKVVNASLGGYGASMLTIQDVILRHPDTLFVVAAGNETNDNDVKPAFPCSLDAPNLICVAAIDRNEGLADFSNFGVTRVDLAAPGTEILSTQPHFDTLSFSQFSGTLGPWTSGGDHAWGIASDQFGPFAADSPQTDAPRDSDSWIQLGTPLDTSGTLSCKAAFWFLDDLAPSDRFSLETSEDGTTWDPADVAYGPSTDDWTHEEVALPRTTGGRMFVRFRLTTGADGSADGVGVDDAEVTCITNTYTGDEYQELEGTSMSSPHVAGAAALLFAAKPDATVAQVATALLGTARPDPALTGKVATGGVLDVAAALAALGT